jgi:uncharacterized membrane protein
MSPGIVDALSPGAPPETPLLSATLTQSRSLDRRGAQTVVLVVAALCAGAATMFALVGAWPVAGFLGLDVLLVWVAFRINARAAAAYEEVTVTAHDLILRRVDQAGHVREVRLNPLWTRLTCHTHPEFGLQRLVLESRGRCYGVGDFLSPADKASFATALGQALGETKRR